MPAIHLPRRRVAGMACIAHRNQMAIHPTIRRDSLRRECDEGAGNDDLRSSVTAPSGDKIRTARKWPMEEDCDGEKPGYGADYKWLWHDGQRDLGEQCDDGNRQNGDGCDQDCRWGM